MHEKKFNEFKCLIERHDIFLLDRGFRDAVSYLEDEHGLICHMPISVSNDQKQLTTYQANTSRFITKCRWVVEVVNAHLKKSFKALAQVHNKILPTVIKDYRIAAALVNKFFSRLISDANDG